MTELGTVATLFRHVRRTGRSLLQYAGESYPWVRDSSEASTLTTLQQMIREEQQAAAAIAKFLMRNHIAPPHFDAYPMEFTNFNFLAVDRLRVLLAEHQARDVADLETDLKGIKDADAKRLLQNLLEIKRRHLDTLRSMSASAAPSSPNEAPTPVAV
jgi:hypothetical protein